MDSAWQPSTHQHAIPTASPSIAHIPAHTTAGAGIRSNRRSSSDKPSEPIPILEWPHRKQIPNKYVAGLPSGLFDSRSIHMGRPYKGAHRFSAPRTGGSAIRPSPLCGICRETPQCEPEDYRHSVKLIWQTVSPHCPYSQFVVKRKRHVVIRHGGGANARLHCCFLYVLDSFSVVWLRKGGRTRFSHHRHPRSQQKRRCNVAPIGADCVHLNRVASS